jgi:hypothetical protein
MESVLIVWLVFGIVIMKNLIYSVCCCDKPRVAAFWMVTKLNSVV